jgi:hypothetical protein
MWIRKNNMCLYCEDTTAGHEPHCYFEPKRIGERVNEIIEKYPDCKFEIYIQKPCKRSPDLLMPVYKFTKDGYDKSVLVGYDRDGILISEDDGNSWKAFNALVEDIEEFAIQLICGEEVKWPE